jgi:hypothetical protein
MGVDPGTEAIDHYAQEHDGDWDEFRFLMQSHAQDPERS